MKSVLKLFFCSLLTTTLVLVLYDVSFAWGAGTHIEVASRVLSNLEILPVNIQALLHEFRYDYIYGCISADIITGKKFIKYIKHCHNWHMGLKVLENAKSDSQRAFAYGYLSHLAADVVAHNYFVPNQIIASFTTRTLKHTYWELRFDSFVNKEVWSLVPKVASDLHADNDLLLKNILDDTLFSFRTNKRIFNSLMLLVRLKQWQNAIDIISKKSQWLLTDEDVQNYKKLILDHTMAFLIDGKKAECCKADPAGRKSLQAANEIRKKLKTLKKSGKISSKDYPDIFEKLKPKFKQATIEEFGNINFGKIIS